MKYTLDIEISDNKKEFAEEFFKTISFVKSVKFVASNEITNPTILKSIEEYETVKSIPTPMNPLSFGSIQAIDIKSPSG
jgi:hypothetical protein